MNDQKTLEMITALCNANGAPGFEDDVLIELRKYGVGLGEITEDSLRNLFIRRKENSKNKPIVLLDAHSDEVAFMVQAIKPNGTLQFITLGGWVANNIPAHKVRVRNAEGQYITGIVASKPPHFMSDAEKAAPASISSMVIDIGATSREEAIHDFKIRIGEPIVPDVEFAYMKDKDLMLGKAFDCRLGCAAILETIRELQNCALNVDLVGAFAAQEEMGTRGATVTANTVKPDIAIVFEGCPADDTFTDSYATQTAIKRGPMLRHVDARMITNPRFQRFALELGMKLGIPVQDAVRAGGSTDGAPIHLSNMSVPVIVIGIPVRYSHTHYGISTLSDYENAVKLACQVIKSLDSDTIKGF